LTVLTLVIVVPSLIAFGQSMTSASLGRPGEFVGIQNYVKILTDPAFWRAALNTFIIVNVVVYGELLLGLGLAALVAGWMPLRGLLVTILLVPYAVSEVSAIIMWRYLFEPDVGLFNWLLLSMANVQLLWPIRPVHGLVLISAVSIWLTLPFTFLILYSAIRSVPKELTEAAVIDGATRFQAFRYVTLNVIKPAILIAILFRYIFSMRIFAEVWLLTGGGPGGQTEVLSTYLYRYGFRYQETGVASAAGWVMLLLSMAVSAFYLYRMYRSGRPNA
ncbi:MAG: sugar ABC transporter permease, partial [Dehalococcoidia bacterium]